MIENNNHQRKRRLMSSSKNEKKVLGTNQFSSQAEYYFPKGYMIYTEELKEVLRRRGKIDP